MSSIRGRSRATPHRTLLLIALLNLVGLGPAAAASPAALSAPENGAVPLPPLGWNSGNAVGCKVDEQLIRETAGAMVSSGMKAAGYQYVIVDGCWQGGRDAAGNVTADPGRFPSGIRALADYVHGRGLKFGLFAEAGEFACQHRPGPTSVTERDARQFAAWGVDAVRYDGCGASGSLKDPELPPVGKQAGTADELRAQYGLWAILAAPLFPGVDVRNMDAVMRSIVVNRQVIAIQQDELATSGRRLRRDGDLDIWARPLADGGWAILMLNRGSDELPAKLDWTELGLPARGSLLLRDLWTGRNVGRQRGGFSTTLAARASLLLRASP